RSRSRERAYQENGPRRFSKSPMAAQGGESHLKRFCGHGYPGEILRDHRSYGAHAEARSRNIRYLGDSAIEKSCQLAELRTTRPRNAASTLLPTGRSNNVF